MKQTTTLGAIAVCAICFFLTVPAAFSQRPAGWKAPSELLAGTELSRARVAKKLGIATGEYVVALVSILCGDCERELKKVNDGTISDHFLVVAPAPAKDVAAWRKRLGFKFRVVAVTDRDMEDLGAVMLPTFVLLRNGSAVGVAETVVFPWQRGDVLALDNMLTAHGRAPYRGPRRVLVGMSEPVTRDEVEEA